MNPQRLGGTTGTGTGTTPCQVPPKPQPGHHVGLGHKRGRAGHPGGGQSFAPASKGELRHAVGTGLAQGHREERCAPGKVLLCPF